MWRLFLGLRYHPNGSSALVMLESCFSMVSHWFSTVFSMMSQRRAPDCQNEIAFVAKTLEVVLIEVLSWEAPWMVGDFGDGLLGLIGVQQCHKPPIWEWFIPRIYGEIGGWCIIVLPAVLGLLITLYKCFFMCFQFGSLNRNLTTRRDHAQTKIGLELFSKNPECT